MGDQMRAAAMAPHSLSQLILHAPISSSSSTSKHHSPSRRDFSSTLVCQATSHSHIKNTTVTGSPLPISRRNVALGFAAAMMGLNGVIASGEDSNALAARPPPTPPKEKTDPNISGVQAKVLASKRRKEAMKEAMAKQRERGKPVTDK